MQPTYRAKRAMVTLSSFRSLEDSNSLFDFTTPINEDNFVMNSTSIVYQARQPSAYSLRKKIQVVSQEDAMKGNAPNFDYKMIFSLTVQHLEKQISYRLDQPEEALDFASLSARQLDQQAFVALNNHGRRNQMKCAKIKQGDIFRLGKTYLRVVETHQDYRNRVNLPDTFNSAIQAQDSSVQPGRACRICLMDDAEGLISPCRCRGSCKYVHLECLKIWLQSKVARHDNRLVSSYCFSKFQCELCKQELSNKIISQGKTHQLVEFHRPDEPYLILERLQGETRDNTLYVLAPKDQAVKLGRGNTSDIRFNDLAMSRIHCTIEFRQGHFYLWDAGSKFGTLLLLQQHSHFDKIMCLQFESRVYKLEVPQSDGGCYPRW